MSRMLSAFALALAAGCTKGADVVVDPFPAFVDDCDEGENDEFDDHAGLEDVEDGEWVDAELCEGDLD